MPTRQRTSRQRTNQQRRALSSDHHSPTNERTIPDQVINGMTAVATTAQKNWFENYVKNTTWIGCKVPQVRAVVKHVVSNTELESKELVDDALQLMCHPAADVKLAGMICLAEFVCPSTVWCHQTFLNRLADTVLPTIHDWSSADWFAMRILRPMRQTSPALGKAILGWCHNGPTLWQRRCGLVAFVQYHKDARETLPEPFLLVEAAEASLLKSPQERFTQTGIAWVLRYALLQPTEKDEVYRFICRHPTIWTKEAKLSFVKSMPKSDSRRTVILNLSREK